MYNLFQAPYGGTVTVRSRRLGGSTLLMCNSKYNLPKTCFEPRIQSYCPQEFDSTGRLHVTIIPGPPQHFLCYACERPLSGDKFMLNEGKPYCQYHYMKMFGVRCFYCDSRSSMQGEWDNALTTICLFLQSFVIQKH